MNKKEMKKGMLLKKKDEAGECIYRVLELAEKILVIDCVHKFMPVWKEYEKFVGFVATKEDINTDRENKTVYTLQLRVDEIEFCGKKADSSMPCDDFVNIPDYPDEELPFK